MKSNFLRKELIILLSILLASTTQKDHLLNEYKFTEILQVDFPDIRRIITKVELLDYLLRRFVHSNLKDARIFNFKFQIREEKIKHYNKMEKEESLPIDFDAQMKQKTLKIVEQDQIKGVP